MSVEPVATTRTSVRIRTDQPSVSPLSETLAAWVVLLVLGGTFVLWGGASLGLGEFESRLGMAASEKLGPFGQVFGGWEPRLWPAQVAPSLFWAWCEGRIPTQGVVRWPAAIAGVVIGLLVGRRIISSLGPRVGVAWGFCWYGSIALIDRASGSAHAFDYLVAMLTRNAALLGPWPGPGLDLLTGLALVGALDRLMNRGPGWAAGTWASLAFLAGGWPPVALVGLAIIAIGRRERSSAIRMALPRATTLTLWSAWAISTVSTEAWAASLALPLKSRPALLLAGGVFILGLPWSPFAALAAFRRVRDALAPPGKRFVTGWIQVAGVSLLAGTFIPGFGSAALVPALVGVAVAAAASLERVGTAAVSIPARRTFAGLSLAVAGIWTVISVVWGVKLVSEVAYYRGLWIILIMLALLTAIAVVAASLRAEKWRALASLAVVALSIKLAHWGYYVPEANYQVGQGAWGRAIGQWVLPRWKIYTQHTWPAELAFAIGRPIRQLSSPRHLEYQKSPDPKFVLLIQNEFDNWPEDAPPPDPGRKIPGFHGPDPGPRADRRRCFLATTRSRQPRRMTRAGKIREKSILFSIRHVQLSECACDCLSLPRKHA